MDVNSVRFVGSYPETSALPAPQGPEFAFVGRSNVGKSSLINMLCNRKQLARTSVNPGKTQTINLYSVDEGWTLVDLPGYGFAKVSKRQRSMFSKLITDYIQERPALICTFVLIDSRVSPQKVDQDFINELGKSRRPFVMVFTKTDKVSKADLAKVTQSWADLLQPQWAELPMLVYTSSVKRTGRQALLTIIEDTLLQSS